MDPLTSHRRVPPMSPVDPGWTEVHRIRWDTMQRLKVKLDPEASNGNDWRAMADFLGFRANFLKVNNHSISCFFLKLVLE